MVTRITLLALLLTATGPLQAEPVLGGRSEIIIKALKDEMKRTVTRLRMDKLGKPYFVRYQVKDWRRFEVIGEFGALRSTEDYLNRYLKVTLRIGNRAFDNSHYVGRDHYRYRPFVRQLVQENDYDALRFTIWQATDKAYKHSVQKLSQKKAYRQARLIKEIYPDLSKDPVNSFEEELTVPIFDKALWEERIRKLSAVFRKYPSIQRSRVALYGMHVHKYSVDSEGRTFVRPEHDFEIYFWATAQAEDGHTLNQDRRIIRQSLEDLPSFDELLAQAEALAKDIDIRVKADMVKGYIGPVLLEGQAAGEFFNQLLARNVSFPRQLWLENEGLKKQFHTGSLLSRAGLRVTSPLLSVHDDPLRKTYEGTPLIGHYTVDDEGIAPRFLTIIEDGILKDGPAARAPTKKNLFSNGHGRGSLDEFETAHISNLFISASKSALPGELKKDLLERAREFGLDYGIIIRRIDEERSRKRDDLLANPLSVFKVYVSDGREVPVRNVRFSAVTLRALRDIVAVSSKRRAYNFYQLGPYSPTRGETQASIIHPDVLLAEMELGETEKKPKRLPYLKRPRLR